MIYAFFFLIGFCIATLIAGLIARSQDKQMIAWFEKRLDEIKADYETK